MSAYSRFDTRHTGKPILSLSKLLEDEHLDGLKSVWDIRDPKAAFIFKKDYQVAKKELLKKGQHTLMLQHPPSFFILNITIRGAAKLWFSNAIDDSEATIRIHADNKQFDLRNAKKRPILPIPTVDVKKQVWCIHYILEHSVDILDLTIHYLCLPESKVQEICDIYELSFVDSAGSLFKCTDREIFSIS